MTQFYAGMGVPAMLRPDYCLAASLPARALPFLFLFAAFMNQR
jgi:hypothetical protein